MRRTIKAQTGINISRSAFWERISSKRHEHFLQLILNSLMAKIYTPINSGQVLLKKLKVLNIFIIDSCTFSLWDGAKGKYPGTFTTAGIKYHACFNLMNLTLDWFKITPSSTHDSQCFPDLNRLKNSLIIFDLGYFDFLLLYRIKEVGGFFLTRVKSDSVIHIQKIIKGLYHQRYIGQSLMSIKNRRKKDNIIEVLIEKKCSNGQMLSCRAIGFWHMENKIYHWYLTNLSVSAKVIYPLYRLRWQIELIFKSCKQSLNAARFTTNNEHIIRSLLLGTLITQFISCTILHINLPHLSKKEQLAISYQRISKITVQLKQDFINFLLTSQENFYHILYDKIRLFSDEIFDPNYKKRNTSLSSLDKVLS
jgi:hypothetical protein